MAVPFEDSRRLTGANLFFAATGAVLDAIEPGMDAAMIDAWRARIERAAEHLRWPSPHTVARRHAGGVSLACSAPPDQLFLATEVNEWALCAAVAQRHPQRRESLESALIAQAMQANADAGSPAATLPPSLAESDALSRFELLARREGNPRLLALLQAAEARGLSHTADEDSLTLGSGDGAHSFALSGLPDTAAIAWPSIHNVPTALVTGSNGKTTTIRLLAAFARAHGWHAGFNCTDGVFLDAEVLASGDYSGPAGARRVLREPRTQAALLETARGGILRRGIAVSQADVAVVTNVSSDHFGEYGIDDLRGLADTKLVVAAVVNPAGLLVVNAEDATLRAAIGDLAARFGRCPPLGWFSSDGDSTPLPSPLGADASVCRVLDGNLVATHHGARHDLGSIARMPLTVGGVARYNIANIAGAALAGLALGIPAPVIAAVLRTFGTHPDDNAGRMMRFEHQGVTVLIDYAHNPEGLRGLLDVAQHLRGKGRLGILLGHAGNRQDEDIRALARVAAQFRPELVVVKENESHLRGRAPGEIPGILRDTLLRLGMHASALQDRQSEIEAARCALDWARPGDVLALPVHALAARRAVVAMVRGAH